MQRTRTLSAIENTRKAKAERLRKAKAQRRKKVRAAREARKLNR